MMATPNAFIRMPMRDMLPSFPFITIFVSVGKGESAQVHFQDLTKATGHREPTRFFHVMFDDDPNKTELVWDLMSTDYRNFYSQLLESKLEEAPGKYISNPLNLPSVNNDIEGEFRHLQEYL